MIPLTGPISIEDFKKTHGCYTPLGNPMFGGSSAPDAPFELSSIFTKQMIPWWHEAYVGDQQDMEDMRGCVASLNRDTWKQNDESFRYPGMTFVYYAYTSGLSDYRYSVVNDGAAGVNYNDPWGTNIRHLIRGKANSGLLGGQNSAVMHTFQFYMETAETLRLKFKSRFTFSGVGPPRDPSPPTSGERQGQSIVAVEYGDKWGGADSNVVLSYKHLIGPNGNSSDKTFEIPYNASRPYKLVSLQTSNHGHPSTDKDDLFRSYFGNFTFSVKRRS